MNKKYIIFYIISALIYIIADNYFLIMNSYQNIFKKRVCISDFCINKPKDYLIARVVDKGDITYFYLPKINSEHSYDKSDTYISFDFKSDISKSIFIGEFNSTIAIKAINKFKFKKVIDECYDATENINKNTDSNLSIYLLCPKKKINILGVGNKDYKTIKNILDGFSIKDKNNSKE